MKNIKAKIKDIIEIIFWCSFAVFAVLAVVVFKVFVRTDVSYE